MEYHVQMPAGCDNMKSEDNDLEIDDDGDDDDD